MENSKTISELFEEWHEQYNENCYEGQDCQYENILPFSSIRRVSFYCDNGEGAMYDLIEDEEYNDSLEYYEEKKYFVHNSYTI